MERGDAKMPSMYDCWLAFDKCPALPVFEEYKEFCQYIKVGGKNKLLNTAYRELEQALKEMGIKPQLAGERCDVPHIFIGGMDEAGDEHLGNIGDIEHDGFIIKRENNTLAIIGQNPLGALYGVFALLREISIGTDVESLDIKDSPAYKLRMINHWDNMDGKIERGYAGNSIFFKDGRIVDDMTRVHDYARLLASVGINAVSINNVNVGKQETKLITKELLPDVARIANVFRDYGIRLYLSINFASSIVIGGLGTADPLDASVRQWWRDTADLIYSYIPDFGGFVVKADSEFQPGPFTYGRDHADGANMLAEALMPHGGTVVWRCFVYNCLMDWRDRKSDRAKAAYDTFKPLDGAFADNVVLQIKHGPMDFQVREPVSPLFGVMPNTNISAEFQITQEYTGQQKHLCYLAPIWKETLDFDTYADGKGSLVSQRICAAAGVSNVGDSLCWTGHPLAHANLYAFGRLSWDPSLSSEQIADEWARLTFGSDRTVVDIVTSMLVESRDIYEQYTAPLGIGWMVNPGHHYGPNPDGYEYPRWGTYHYADHMGIGVDRTIASGTGYTAQYAKPVCEIYDSIKTCPDELLLFFHHVPYTHILKSGKTVIQHIYDSHFDGVERAMALKEKWGGLKGKVDEDIFAEVLSRLDTQINDAIEWRDVINTYFYRKSWIKDERGRKIYD